MAISLERDLIGYGGTPPDPQWPNGARLALNFVLNYEEGSEYSIGDKDGVTDAGLVEMSGSPVTRGERDLAAEIHVRIWQQGRLLAVDAHLRRA